MSPTTQIDWQSLIAKLRPMYEVWGPAVTAQIYGLSVSVLRLRAHAHGVHYQGERIGKHSLPLATRVAQAKAWCAGGGNGVPGQQQVAPEPGRAPDVKVRNARPAPDGAVVITSETRITIAPPLVDRRYEPAPGFKPLFSATRPGLDPLTRRPWK